MIPRSDRQKKKKDETQRERDDPTRANPRARCTVLVERIDGYGEGEHPVHADDIPEVQRTVFRGYRCSEQPVTSDSEASR